MSSTATKKSGLKLLVTGGRTLDQSVARAGLEFLAESLRKMDPPISIGLLAHGGAKGADSAAGSWATDKGIPTCVFQANWAAHGNSAGPKRNIIMFTSIEPDFVFAFEGGNGTQHMADFAFKSGGRVIHWNGKEIIRIRTIEDRKKYFPGKRN